MTENVYERIHRVLTWQRIAAFNLVLFLVLVVPISLRLAESDTENRSGAAGSINPLPSVEPPTAYPADPPKIDRVNAFFGKTGDTIVILGANFGEYRWGSKVYVGNVEAPSEAILRWSTSILEVQIPESARTGRVWVVVNGKQAAWEGSLLLTDISRSAQVGLRKISSTSAMLWLTNARGVTHGLIEVSYLGEPIASLIPAGSITSQVTSVDSLGKKLKVDFALTTPLDSTTVDILTFQHPGIGPLELLRVELYDATNTLVSVYADPLNVKTN